MPAIIPGAVATGYLNFLDREERQKQQALQRQILQMQLERASREAKARSLAGTTMAAMGGPGGAPQMPQPTPSPMPGQPSTPMQPAGGGTPPAQDYTGKPGGYLSYDDHVQRAQQPPAFPEAPSAEKAAAAAPPKRMDIGSIVQTMKANGVPDDMVMDVLQEMTPMMNAQNKAELEQLRVQLQIDRNVNQVTLAGFKLDIDKSRLEAQKEKIEADKEYKSKSLAERTRYHQDTIQYRNREADAQIRRADRLARNDTTKDALTKIKAVNAQMKSIEQEFPQLTTMAIQGNQAEREAAAARLEVLRGQYDQLYMKYSDMMDDFTDQAETPDQPAQRPTSAGSARAAPPAAAGKPKPTQPDREWVKSHPGDRQKFIDHFGVEP